MKQVFVDRNGKIQVEEVPTPPCGATGVLIDVAHCLISAGTEMSAVKSFVQKAAERPEARRQVLDSIKTQGLTETARKIMDRLRSLTPLGYQGAGRVIATGDEVRDIAPGDLVAYAGSNHAEQVYAPRNLMVKMPRGVSTREAAFVALGAIAMHGVRRTEVQFGDRVALIGLGLVGQLTAQLLDVSGARVIAFDLAESRLELARRLTRGRCLNPKDCDPVQAVMDLTGGYGADAVIIAASSRSSDIVRQAALMARDRSRINVVGWVGMDLDQHPLYTKELSLVLSRSYGPGRYDEAYEQAGRDYPIGYVRWTENRNMAEFLDLVAEKRVNVADLITDEFGMAEAASAYGKIATEGSATMGVLLRGAAAERPASEPPRTASVLEMKDFRPRQGTVGFGVVGLGWFAKNMHLPNLRRLSEAQLVAVADIRGDEAMQCAKRYGARKGFTSYDEMLAMPELDAVVITTRHHLHADMAVQAAEAKKHVFVEKPLALTVEDAVRVQEAVERNGILLTVGFNRRFSPLTRRLEANLRNLAGPMVINMVVNAGAMDPDSWQLDPKVGGGRIHGEICHFFDLVTHLVGAEPESISGAMIASTNRRVPEKDNVALAIRFTDGSLAQILYTSLGHKSYPKERLEVYRGGVVQVIDNFQHLRCFGCRGDTKLGSIDKGHLHHMRSHIRGIKGQPVELPNVLDGIRAVRMAVAAETALTSGSAVPI